ncbi:biotin/lipoyl-containing protein [Planococcus sp. ISL-110]|uniref:biotin/lipoyl-containing protein n=1 Tax=Planococcus sp. ISL-110 TaxID=2819167 RepID=UPI001BE6EE03|nr:biotin/lipoyl-containing protein [Planococcus sp. ISL-110]MBT2570095.1 E3 binding domain-containing protein [Planococcus sp. ISL-110]
MIEVRLPQLAEDVDESLMVLWFVSVGDFVEKGQPLVEVQTEKAVSEITAENSGTIQEIAVKRGDSAKVGDLLATIDPDGAPGQEAVAKDAQPTQESSRETESKGQEPSSFVRVSPRLRRLAKDLGVNLESVKGSGPQGFITEEDIRDEAGL